MLPYPITISKSSAWNGLKSIWNSISSWFQDTIGGIVDTVKGIFGIASPSKVFYGFGVNIGEGLIEGLSAMEPAVANGFESMLTIPDVPADTGFSNGGRGGSSTGWNNTREGTYVAAPNASFDAKEELFQALGSPRVGDV